MIGDARNSHWKWRETKLQPSRGRSGNQIRGRLVSLHFLCDILVPITVLNSDFYWIRIWIRNHQKCENLSPDPDPGRNHNTFTVDTRSSGQRWPTARRELTPDGPDSNDSFDI